MKINKLLNVSIGIPVYNEENNIESLIRSIFNQKQTGFRLEKIFVISDGSNDDTDKIVKKNFSKNPKLVFSNDGKRKGKNIRLMEIYKKNQSDIIVQFDGDIKLANDRVISLLISKFRNSKVDLVTGNNQPYPPRTFVQSLLSYWYQVWYLIRKDYRGGHYIQNAHSCILAMRKNFSKRVHFGKSLVSDAQFIYCLAKKENHRFAYQDKALIYFILPDNLSDYFLQNNRYVDEKKSLAGYFGDWIYKEYPISWSKKIEVLTKEFFTHPVKLITSYAFIYLAGLFKNKRYINKYSQIWPIIRSTKVNYQTHI